MAEAQHAAAARAATPEGALACAPARDRAHRRGVLYLRMHGRPVGNTGARQSKIELVAAVRMVARGCACERTLGLGSACGGGRKRLCHPWLLKSRVEPSGNLLIGGLSYGGA